MRRSEEEGVRRLLSLGWRLLRGGQAREAADAFGRVLLRRPEQTEARDGAARAYRELAEQYRLGELSSAAPRKRAHAAPPVGAALPARVSSRTERRRSRSGGERGQGSLRLRRGESRGLVWGRRLLLTAGALAVTLALTILSLRWPALMDRLSQPPTPTSTADAPTLGAPAVGAGQGILVEAHRRIEHGDPTAARELLQSIGPEDPAYPFAQRLQLELPPRGEQR